MLVLVIALSLTGAKPKPDHGPSNHVIRKITHKPDGTPYNPEDPKDRAELLRQKFGKKAK